MNEIPLAPGESARYEYDPRSDSLYIELTADAADGDFEPMAEMPQVSVRHVSGGTAIQALTVKGVQALILQHLVRDIVSMARGVHADAAAAAAGAQAEPERPGDVHEAGQDVAETVAGEADAPDGASPDRAPDVDDGKPRSDDKPKGKKRKGRRKGKGRRPPKPDEAAAETLADEASGAAVVEAALGAAAVEPAAATAGTSEAAPVEVLAADEVAEAAPAEVPVADETATEVPVSPAPAPTALDAETPKPEYPVPAAFDTQRPSPRAAATEIPHVVAPVPVPDVSAAITPAPEGDDTPEGFRGFGLEPRIGAALAAMGFSEPTPIQERSIPVAMTGSDLVGLAQTGTGKTVAFLVPALHRILSDPDGSHRPRLLVVTPTRELAVQIGQQVELLTQFTKLGLAVVYGGAGMKPQVDALRKGADVIVATPGRLLDHVRRGNARLRTTQVLVLDEADRMLDMGFMPDVRRILERLPEERQTMLYGATLPPDIESLSRKFQRDPQLVEVARQLPPATLEQALYPVGRHLKIPLLTHLLQTDAALSKVLVFTETKVETDIVARKVKESGLKVASMHGDRPQRDRERALGQLKGGQVQVLVATNVAARGLDIEDVTHVVNYDMPQTVDDYVHRIGRTARGAAAEGMAYTFVTVGDEDMVQRIQSALGRELPRVKAEGFDYDVPTPSWAQPSSRDVAKSLNPPSLSNLSRSFRPRRR